VNAREDLMPQPPRVTVITVVRNDASGLGRTMDSVAAQDYPYREYVIVDGASTDGTREVLERRAKEAARWISEPDTGIFQAMNKGVRMATGDYVCFMNAGDRFAAANTLSAMFNPPSKAELLWGDCIIESRRGEEYDCAQEVLKKLHHQMTVSHQSLFVRRESLLRRPFVEELRIAADYDFLCERLLAGAAWEYRPVPVSRTNDTGVSARIFRISIREKRAISLARFPSRRLSIIAYYFVLELYMTLKTAIKSIRGR
jgi:glycosyltransferase involved in cell wall biosynthesis